MGEERSCCPGIKAGQDKTIPYQRQQLPSTAAEAKAAPSGILLSPKVPHPSLPHCSALLRTTWMGLPSHPTFPAPKVPPRTPNRSPVLLGKCRIPSVYCHIKTLAGMEDEEWKHILSIPRTVWLPPAAPSGSHPAAKLSGSSQSSPGRPEPSQVLSLGVGSAQPVLS